MASTKRKAPPALPAAVVEEDNRLRQSAERSSEELAQLRWHWTLNPDGPGLSFAEYARQVGDGSNVVRSYALAWKNRMENVDRGQLSITDHRRLAALTESRQTATKAVAEVEGRSVSAVTSDREMRLVAKAVEAEVVVRETDHAEEHGTTEGFDAAAEARRVAQAKLDARKTKTYEPTEPTAYDASLGINSLVAAGKALREANDHLKLKPELPGAAAEALTEAWNTVRRWYQSVEMAVEVYETDLDAELAAITEGS